MRTDLVGTHLGEFDVVRELGRGGMGIVYEAVQTSLGRRVALKVLASGLGLTPRAVDRFRREAAAAARLHHTNIVPVYSTGEEGGVHFYAMELIDGPSLHAVIRQMRAGSAADSGTEVHGHLTATGEYVPPDSTPISSGSGAGSRASSDRFDRAAAMIADVADALHHAHQNGVTHRDIKPSNLMLSSDGRLSVTDFGLARMLEQPGMTVTGEFVGTPAYMSPEQVTAGRVAVDHRTDIYSLGATLYELLTLRPPFRADGRDKLLAMVIQKEPLPPRSIDPKIPRDLETICLKCLEKDPDRRYPSAKELADDLRRYVNRFAIRAKRTGPLTRLKKWLKRNPALSAASLVVLLALGMAGFFAWRAYESEQQRLANERERADEVKAEKRRAAVERGMAAALAVDLAAAEKAVAEAELLGESAGQTRLLRGFIALHSGRPAEAIGHLEQAARLMPDSVAARALFACAHAAASDWTTARRVVAEAAAMTPRTPEDKLFLGRAIGEFQPAEGLPLMNDALAERPSGIGHVMRADLRVTLATDTGVVADADAAIADAEMARRLLPGNPYPLSTVAFAQLSATAAYRHAGRADRAEEHLAAASRVTDELARFRGNYDAVFTRYCVAIHRDGLNGRMDMLAELHQTRATAPAAGLAFLEAYNLFCLGRDVEAAAVADKFPDDRLNAQIRIFVALGRPDGRADARRAWEPFGGSDQMPNLRLEAAPMLFAIGRPGEIETLVHDLRSSEHLFRHTTYSPDERVAFLAFLEGNLSRAGLLGRPVSAEPVRCRRHYLIGWERLGAGDRAGAETAFREAYRATSLRYQYFWNVRAFLIRMKDASWPRAIPAKE